MLKRSAWILFSGFLLANVVAYNHAYKFTHFDAGKTQRTSGPEELSAIEKASILFTGISNPKPVNQSFPTQSYKRVLLPSQPQLEGWFIEIPHAIGTVILFHGYAGEKSQLLTRSNEFLSMGYNTFLIDFMGSGGSEGDHTTIGFDEAQQVLDSYKYIKHSGEKNILLFGTSMGAAAILKMISDSHVQPAAIILECPFGSLYKTIGARFDIVGVPRFPMAGLLAFWGSIQCGFWVFSHNPSAYANAVECPTLLMYGELDDRVSREETDAIFNNLKGEKILKTYPMAGHFLFTPEMHDAWVSDVNRFLTTIGQTTPRTDQ